MSHEFFIRLKSRVGVTRRSVIGNYLWLIYRNVVNQAGRVEFALPVSSGIADLIQPYDQIEVWRRDVDTGIPWHRDFSGLFMDSDITTDEDGREVFIAYGIGDVGMLAFRQVSWPAGVANRSYFEGVPAETALKTLVQYNCTASASVANGRIREGDLGPGMGFTITMEADGGGGELVYRYFANGNLLPILSETIAPNAGGDFSLDKTGDATWEFRWHEGQLGEDKSSGAGQIEFSMERNNMRNPILRTRRSGSKSVAVVGGQGPGTERDYTVVLGSDYAADHDIEMYIDARNEPSAEARQFTGETALAEREVQQELTFDALQTEAIFYSRVAVPGKKTYREGDLVLAKYKGISQVRKVTGVTVDIRKRGGAPPFEISTDTEVVV